MFDKMEGDILDNVKVAFEKGKHFVSSSSTVHVSHNPFTSSLFTSFEIEISPELLDYPRVTPPSIPPSTNRHSQILKKIDSLRKMSCVSSVLDVTASPAVTETGLEEEERVAGGNLSKSLSSLVFDEDVSTEEEVLLRHVRLSSTLSDLFCAILGKSFRSDLPSPSSPSLSPSPSPSPSPSSPLPLLAMKIDCESDRLVRGCFCLRYRPSPDAVWSPLDSERCDVDIAEVPPQRSRMIIEYSSVRYLFEPLPFSLSPSWERSFSLFIDEIKCFPFALVENDVIKVSLDDLISLFGESVRGIIRELKKKMIEIATKEGWREEEEKEIEINGADFMTYPEVNASRSNLIFFSYISLPFAENRIGK